MVVHALGPKAGRQKQADLVYILNSKPTKDRVLKNERKKAANGFTIMKTIGW